MLSLGHMTKACALIGPLRGVLKKTLPGVGSFLESVSALFGASEAFLILVTLYEKAKQKSSRGGGKFLAFSTLWGVKFKKKVAFSTLCGGNFLNVELELFDFCPLGFVVASQIEFL